MRGFAKFDLVHIFLGILLFLCISETACQSDVNKIKESSQAVRTEKKTDLPVDKCAFEKFDPKGAPISVYSKLLMYKLGTGIMRQPGGSLVKIQCPDGSTHTAWIDSEGALASIIYGLKFDDTSFLASYPGKSVRLRLLEKKDDGWVEVSVPFKDVKSPLPAGSKVAAYSMFPNISISDYSARLLKYLGIGREGSESTVRLNLGDSSGTGLVDSSGTLKVTNEKDWEAPIE